MKLRTRILISYLLLALLPVLVAGTVFVVLGQNSLRNQFLQQLETTASIQKKRVEAILDRDRERLAFIESRPSIQQGLAEYVATGNPASLDTLTKELTSTLSVSKDFKTASALDDSGKVIASSNPALVGKDLSGSTYFQRGKVGNEGNVFAAGPGDQLLEYLAGPVSVGGRQQGVVVMETTASELVELMRDHTGLGRTGETVLAEKTPKGDALFLGPTRFGAQHPLSTVVPASKANVPINIALQGKVMTLTNAVDYRGHRVLAATQNIGYPPLGLAVKIDTSEAFSPIYNLLIALGVVVAGVALLAILAALLISRTVTRPVLELAGVAEAIGAGDLSRRSGIVRDDEIGDMARAFDKMTDDLVSEREGLERKVEERTTRLARTNLELDGYAHTVSHDLRGPISAINLAASILAESLAEGEDLPTREDLLELTEQITRSTDRSFKLINDLLNLAAGGQKPAEVEPVDIRETVARVLEDRVELLMAGGACVELQAELGTVVASPIQIYQLFSNLIGNAIKHNDSADPLVRVLHLGETADGGHRYAVTDNGPGIKPEDMPRIFEPFFKGRGGETGIGLATVEKIVGVYGGKIEARNEEQGTTFEFTLFDYPHEESTGAGHLDS